jgi:hypothetical protein
MLRRGVASLILLSAAVAGGPISAPAAPPDRLQQCHAVSVDRERIPLNVSLFRLEGTRIVPGITVPRDRLPPSFQDCSDPVYYGVLVGGAFYLVRRSEFSGGGVCSCHAKATNQGGEAGIGKLPRCTQCP